MAMRRWMELSRDKYAVAYERFMATPAGNLGYYAPWRLLPALRFKPWQSLYGHLDEFFGDDRVTYALAYPSKYLGLHPTTCSSVFSVIPYLELAFGVWHVQGGFRELARGMQRCAEDLGARFRFSSPVRTVWIDAAHARGVELASGERIEADAVVVNADLPYAATRLVDSEWRAGTRLSRPGAGACPVLVQHLHALPRARPPLGRPAAPPRLPVEQRAPDRSRRRSTTASSTRTTRRSTSATPA